MIKQYIDYKKIKTMEVLASPLVSDDEKKRLAGEYQAMINKIFDEQDSGYFVINKAIANEIMQLVREGKIPLVMDVYDYFIIVDKDMPNGENYSFSKISDLVAVHKSAIPPQYDTIFTKENNGDKGTIVFVDPTSEEKRTHVVTYASGSDTIHFTLNCAVENHDVGNDWDSYKYAVMIGLDKLDKTRILDVKSEDTYVDGNAELGDDYILFCPLGEREKMKKDNPNAIVIEYDGISLNDAISSMIVYSGKKLEPYGTYGWDRVSDLLPPSADNVQLDKVLLENGYPNLRCEYGAQLHSESKYMARRMWKREYEAIISLLEYNRDNNIDMPDDVLVLILKSSGAYATPGLLTVSVENYKEFVLPILEKHGYVVGDDFFEGISPTAGGQKYVSYFADSDFAGRKMPLVQCPEWENELRNRTIQLIKEKTYVSEDSPKGVKK